jgi:hypothetical protein
MRTPLRFKFLRAGFAVVLLWGAGARGQTTFHVRVLAEGLQEPQGVAIHPATGDIYVAERGRGRILVLKNGTWQSALASNWTVSANVPRWAITPQMPRETWLAAQIDKPGPISIASNGTLFVSEQKPNGRILEFLPDGKGQFAVAKGVPVPWLDQEFQWRDLFADRSGRLYIAGTDEVGSGLMKFGSALVREPDGNWWVIDFGPFANFCTFAISERQDVMLLGDRNQGILSWWEVNRHLLLGGFPDAKGHAELSSLAIYPDGSFILAAQTAPGKAALSRMDPFTGQQTVLAEDFQSIGDIAVDREHGRYLVTDPVGGRLLECTPNPPVEFNEVVLRQMVQSIEDTLGLPTEAPAFLKTFFDRLQTTAKDILPADAKHPVRFNLSDIAGKLPIVAGRVRANVVVKGAEKDPIELVDFFLLFPREVVMTETAVSPSLSYFMARRKSGRIEQTKPVFHGDVGVYRLSGTNISQIANALGGLLVPVVVCGMHPADGGVYVNLSFLGSGIYGDYYLTLFQGPQAHKAKLVVRSASSKSGSISYDASFMEDAIIQGKDGSITKKQVSNLLISGFGAKSAATRSVGWLKLGQFPAGKMVSTAPASPVSQAVAPAAKPAAAPKGQELPSP